MKKNSYKEVSLAVALLVISALLLNPFHFWMPDAVVVIMLAGLLCAFALLAGFVLRETSIDEREEANRALSGRNAYLAGTAVVIVAIGAEGLRHRVDPWLVIALLSMLAAKFFTRIWADTHR